MSGARPTVAHLVTPYLFLTGSWVHAQIVHNRRHRPVVMTQGTENLDVFPLDPVYDFSAGRAGARRIAFAVAKYLLGRFPAAPYVDAARRERVRLLHAHQGWEGARTAHLRRALGIPHVTSFYGRDASMLPRKAYWRALYRRLFREGDLFLAEGSHSARVLVAIGCPEEKVRVIHLGVDPERIPFRERRAAPGEEIVGLIAASFREKKGIGDALDAFARAAARRRDLRLRLRVIGDGPLRPRIEARVSAGDLAGKVDLLGYQPFPRYLEELARAHFLLSPSVTAADGDCEGGAPVCLLDAQAAGLPILGTTHCDIPEVTVPERSAFLVPERDVSALAGALERFLAAPERWGEMGRAGRAHVEQAFDIRKQAEKLADLYDELRSAAERGRE
ncbi:MAG: glycosyltransferase [Candidatus Eisenbacteria bacterium]|nr:glycosyltransferase [Candidatus Latescibacterota bacterium]MBD3303044.1 glycosyltransferase [Candidatus Eisenbacteria bacterium]